MFCKHLCTLLVTLLQECLNILSLTHTLLTTVLFVAAVATIWLSIAFPLNVNAISIVAFKVGWLITCCRTIYRMNLKFSIEYKSLIVVSHFYWYKYVRQLCSSLSSSQSTPPSHLYRLSIHSPFSQVNSLLSSHPTNVLNF